MLHRVPTFKGFILIHSHLGAKRINQTCFKSKGTMKTKDCKKLNLHKSKTWQLKETLELTTFAMLMETQSLIQKKLKKIIITELMLKAYKI